MFRDDEPSEELHLQSVTSVLPVVGVEPFLGRLPDVQAESAGLSKTRVHQSPALENVVRGDPNALGRAYGWTRGGHPTVGVRQRASHSAIAPSSRTLMAMSPRPGRGAPAV